jgi:hypothetical protein
MNFETRRKIKVALSTALVMGATALASSVTLPNTFVANTPARASEVNANFAAVKSAVDDNHARLTVVEGTAASLSTVVSSHGTQLMNLAQDSAAQGSTLTTLSSNYGTLSTTVGAHTTSINSLNATTWKRTGNLGTNPNTDYLGTADNTPLDLRVNASSVMRLNSGQVAVNSIAPPAGVEATVRGAAGSYSNLYMAQGDDSAGFLISVGDASQNANDPRYHKGSFYLDAYDPGFVQQRRMTIDEAGRVGLNRSDAFIGGQPVAFAVGTSTANGNGAHLTLGGTWTSTSSRALKHAFQAVNTGAVLEKVVALPITSWEYRGSPEGRHLGPVAEDFHDAFGLAGEGKFLSANDLAGVSLAAVKGLNEKLERENATLRAQLDAQQKAIDALTHRVDALGR